MVSSSSWSCPKSLMVSSSGKELHPDFWRTGGPWLEWNLRISHDIALFLLWPQTITDPQILSEAALLVGQTCGVTNGESFTTSSWQKPKRRSQITVNILQSLWWLKPTRSDWKSFKGCLVALGLPQLYTSGQILMYPQESSLSSCLAKLLSGEKRTGKKRPPALMQRCVGPDILISTMVAWFAKVTMKNLRFTLW